MSEYKDRLGGYVEVKDRIRLFYEAFDTGAIVTESVTYQDIGDEHYVVVQALAYRSPDDPHPARGSSWMKVPGSTPYTKGSELENTETSAWGRAIGALNIGITNSIATSDEIQSKTVKADVEHADDGSLIGVVQVGDRSTSDYLLRQTPDGSALGFRLRGERGGILVRCLGPLADQLFAHKDEVIGKRATVWGRVTEEAFTPNKPNAREVRYQVLSAERVRVPDLGDLPLDEPAVLNEAESEAIWDAVADLEGAAK